MILIIDDDIAIRTSLSLMLKQANYQTASSDGPEEAMKILKQQAVELIIMDMNFSLEITGEEGLQLLKEIKKFNSQIPVILITAWGSIELAVKGMKEGASNFITKPWNNEQLLQAVKTALSLSADKISGEKQSATRKQLDQQYDFEKLVGEEPSFLKSLEPIGRVSATDASVLIVGDSGTGKELLAEALHVNSPRRNKPFIKVNLGGISSSLFESEMFGHKKGAFTDARFDHTGRIEMAHTGTIFLDEIGDLGLNSQVKLLRVLQDRTFEILGSSKTKTADFRVVCATNRNLETMVEEKKFREDLYYRSNLITIKVPALRERPEDIPLLVSHYVHNLKTIYQQDELKVTKKALKWLQKLPWPGNVRELKNLVERTVLVTLKNVLDVEDFSAQMQTGPSVKSKESLPAVGTMTLDEIEKSMILKAFEFHNKNISKVARSLGLSRPALYRRMQKYGISE